MPKFFTGQVLATRGVSELVEARKVNPIGLLQRHIEGDWGDLCIEDKRQNDLALRPGREGRLHSSYQIDPDLKVWVITEWDRSVTTLLLPVEY